jgi:hypothetical protein
MRERLDWNNFDEVKFHTQLLYREDSNVWLSECPYWQKHKKNSIILHDLDYILLGSTWNLVQFTHSQFSKQSQEDSIWYRKSVNDYHTVILATGQCSYSVSNSDSMPIK